MHKLKVLTLSIIMLLLLSVASPSVGVSARPLAQATTPIGLGTAGNFAVLAGAEIDDSSISNIITGDVGLSPAAWTTSSPLLTCGEVVAGTIYSVDISGPIPCTVQNAGLLTTAKNDLTTAYNDAVGRTPVTLLPGGDNQLGGQTLLPGIYTFGGATTANLVGTLTLDALGDPNAVFIFQASSTLVTASASVVQFLNVATCNVFWQVTSSATLGSSSNFIGTIMADQSITDASGSTISGRLLARSAAVTLNATTITIPVCAAVTPPTGGGEDEGDQTYRPPVRGLPNTGGAPIRNDEFPWSLVVVGAFGAIALGLSIRSYRRNHLRKQ